MLWANKPDLAREWTEKYGPKIKPGLRKLTETHKRMKEKQSQ